MSAQRPGGPGFGLAFVPVRRANPLVVAWRWRYELTAAAGLAALAGRIGPLWTVLFGLACAGSTVLAPVRRRAWCVVTPHRVRTGCAHAWVHSRTGRLPMVLRTRPVPGGEEVLLWLRPGMSAGDLADAAPTLAAACWARDVVVRPDPDRGHLVRLTVLRL